MGVHIQPLGFLFFFERQSLCLWTAFRTLSQIAYKTRRGRAELHTVKPPTAPGCFCPALETRLQRSCRYYPVTRSHCFLLFSSDTDKHMWLAGNWESYHAWFWNEGLNFWDAAKAHRPCCLSPPIPEAPPQMHSLSKHWVQQDLRAECWEGTIPSLCPK